MSFPAISSSSSHTVTVDRITHAEIQRNLGSSQNTVVNSGVPLLLLLPLPVDKLSSQCSRDTLEVWNLNRIWVGK